MLPRWPESCFGDHALSLADVVVDGALVVAVPVAAVRTRWALGTFGWMRQHYRLVMRLGGGMLVVLGVLLPTGYWDEMSVQMRVWTSSFEVVI